MFIYKITNQINNKVYIGQTIQNPNRRWEAHKKPSILKQNKTYLAKAMNKYGKENFVFEVIETVNSMEDLNNKECFWIGFYDSRNKEKGYNLAYGGGNRKTDEETKIKISKSNLGKSKPPLSDEHRRKLSEAAKKRKISKEVRKKMSESHKGLKPSEETRKKLSDAKRGKPKSIEHLQKIRETKIKKGLIKNV